MSATDWQIAKYIAEHCVYYPEGRMFGKGAGARYTSQFYLAGLTTNGEMMNLVCDRFEELLKENNLFENIQFAGREWSAYPILGALAVRFPHLNTFMIRRERKNYGKHNVIEGIPNKHPVVLVDDLCNSTIGFQHCKQVLLGAEIPVHDKILVIMNKKNQTDDGFLWDKYSEQESMWLVSRDMVFVEHEK